MNCSTPDFPIFHYLSSSPWIHTHAHWVNDAIQISHPVALFSSFPVVLIAWGSFPISWIFASGDQNIGHLSFCTSSSNEYSELVSFRIDWFDLLAVQGTLKSLLQHHNLKASSPWHSTLLMLQLSHLHMITGKTIALTIWTFVSKVISLLFNTLSRFVRAILPRTSDL